MRELPEYSITELVLAALCFAVSVGCFLWAAHALAESEPFSAAQGFGAGLMLLGGCADPKKHLLDCLTFPFSVAERAGRDSLLTVAAAYLGFAPWLAGSGLEWFYV
jgi:hypothetical protein